MFFGSKAYASIVREASLIGWLCEKMAGTNTEIEKLPEMLQNFTVICEQAIEELKQEIA